MSDPAADDQRYETFVARFAHHEPDLRRFVRSLLPTWTDADEVVQQTAIVAWRKFDQYDPDTNFMKWACVIARFEALAYRRKMARDRLVFREEIMEMMAEAISRDMEEVLINGDTLSADPFLAVMDGVLKQATSNIVDASAGSATHVNRAFHVTAASACESLSFVDSLDEAFPA